MLTNSEQHYLPDIDSILPGYHDKILGTLYEMTPNNPIVPITGSLEITLKPKPDFGEGKKIVVIHCTSYLFEILNPTGRDGVITQIYGFYTKNDVIKFRIALREEKEPKVNFEFTQLNDSPDGSLWLWTGGIRDQEMTERAFHEAYFKNSNTHLLPNSIDWAVPPIYKEFWCPCVDTVNDDIKERREKFKEECLKFKGINVDPELRSQNCYPSTLDNPVNSAKSEKSTKKSFMETEKAENATLKSTKTEKSMTENTKTLKSSKRSEKTEKTAATTEIQSKSEYGNEEEEKQEEKSKKIEKPKKKNPCCVII